MVMGKLSTDSLAIAAKNAAHAIVRNQRLLTSIEELINNRTFKVTIKKWKFIINM